MALPNTPASSTRGRRTARVDSSGKTAASSRETSLRGNFKASASTTSRILTSGTKENSE